MPVTPASLQDFRLDAFSVIGDMYAKPLWLATNLRFDLAFWAPATV
jgi:hypothetical protein